MNKVRIETEKGFTEAIIDSDCDYEKFYKAADILQTNFGLTFIKELDDFDTLYRWFEYKGSKLILHYNIYYGITIIPAEFKEASQIDNDKATEIGNLLFEKLLEMPDDKEE